ncbi:signal peptidase II [Actinophytocola oryzae]|uniref:Lipoprotein signal peptidase n=1 Tax=Actinophytocola oryzae TaxID=502181 RepID=A0A4V3FV58_9PSEU|nr:signal peptidase II [Actinophytocola oryzae]TDV57891.1 lipoprotein signal peptidase [Actinophytocola oryzae]
MSYESTTTAVRQVRATRARGSGHRPAVLALLAAVILVDQLGKWWAWRHAPFAKINYGGNIFVGDTISDWYADPATGALLDLVDFGLLSTAAFVLIRLRPPAATLVPGGLMVGGWISNLLDRLGLHLVTAPGSVRGAVDFIPLGPIRYNLADVFIVCGTLLFTVAVTANALSVNRSVATPHPPPTRQGRRRTWLSGVATAACLVVVVAFGAVNYGGVTTPNPSSGRVRIAPWGQP